MKRKFYYKIFFSVCDVCNYILRQVVTVENRVKTIRQDSIKVDDETRIPYLPGLSLPKPEPAPAPSTDRSKDTVRM